MSLKVVILTCQVYLQCDLIFIKEKTVIFKYIKLYLMKSLSRYMTQCKQWVGELWVTIYTFKFFYNELHVLIYKNSNLSGLWTDINI